ncbi:hypothetical protein [Rhodococcoides fascians]|uniref:hypothetical protein n=1 Tax=Rhodococcoides fascians TaxID=1828 RepID=UPI0024BBE1F9|nr:hypothetical protein [Rhodococcus fascians]MDJ0467284.1 hypothetical protein [Rhodococcus fascians]
MSRPNISRSSAVRYVAVVLGMFALAAAAAEFYWPLLPATAVVVLAVQFVRPEWLWGSHMHELDEFFAWVGHRAKAAVGLESNR